MSNARSEGPELAATLDPARRSWVPSANDSATDFPIQNLPYGVFRRSGETARVGVAIGDQIVDLRAALSLGLLHGDAIAAAEAAQTPSCNALMALGREPARALRIQLSELLRAGGEGEKSHAAFAASLLIPSRDAELLLPAHVGDYTDFYASVHHATNVGALFRPDEPLLPNYKWVPIGYHGRASSVVVSGTPVRRPYGQRKAPTASAPTMGPSRALDYELEVAAWVGAGNALGEQISIHDAEQHLFGLSLLNDWSARDIQAWEYQPLGPFLGKSFASTVSPWIVTIDALTPFRAPVAARATGDPAPLPYLTHEMDRAHGGVAVTLEVLLRTPQMRERNEPAVGLTRGNLLDLYWSFAQMLTHHASNGCNLRPGDLLGSGTVSGASPGARGCLLELTRRAADPITLPNGETRGFLLDGDEVILRGRAERDGAVSIGFGDCAGVVAAAGNGDT